MIRTSEIVEIRRSSPAFIKIYNNQNRYNVLPRYKMKLIPLIKIMDLALTEVKLKKEGIILHFVHYQEKT